MFLLLWHPFFRFPPSGEGGGAGRRDRHKQPNVIINIDADELRRRREEEEIVFL